MKKMRSWLVMVLASALLSACTPTYLAQSAAGHVKLLSARQNVEKLATDQKQPEALRQQMALARDIRQFASDELALPDNKSYKSYVDLGRDYVTVAIFAAPEFSLRPLTWCFPVFGCVPYRAHFSLEAARREAGELRQQGYDVHVTGITAYSTLGWTPDPLLNTMFRDDETHLPSVVFHELAHQKVYIKNDSAFNEAFAVAVERTGVRKWLLAQAKADVLADYEQGERRAKDFLGLVDKTRRQLNAIYTSNRTDSEKQAQKAKAIAQLRANYKHMRNTRWNGFDGYDGWFNADINNAKIAATAVYSDLVPDFLKLFDACGGDYPRFYKAVEQLGNIRREDRLNALEAARCG